MTTRRATTRRKPAASRAKVAEALPVPPPMPPEPPADPVAKAEISRILREMCEQQERRNLETAVMLAQQAASRQGPLVEHFMELGRRFAPLVRAPRIERRRAFEVIEGGAA